MGCYTKMIVGFKTHIYDNKLKRYRLQELASLELGECYEKAFTEAFCNTTNTYLISFHNDDITVLKDKYDNELKELSLSDAMKLMLKLWGESINETNYITGYKYKIAYNLLESLSIIYGKDLTVVTFNH